MLGLRVTAPARDGLTLARIVEVGEARVVELQVRAPQLSQPAHLLPVRGREVAPELARSG